MSWFCRKPEVGVVDRFLQVQQAQVVFAAFADDDVGAAFGWIGPDAGDLGLDLALQVTGESADPDWPFVLLGPDAGGGEIAERLAGSGARFGQDQMRIAFRLARQERGGRGSGVIGLTGPLLGVRAQICVRAGRAPRPRKPGCDEGGGGTAVSSNSGRRRHTFIPSIEAAAPGWPKASIT